MILVTGGLQTISGSHTCSGWRLPGCRIWCSTTSATATRAFWAVLGASRAQRPSMCKGDVRRRPAGESFAQYPVTAVGALRGAQGRGRVGARALALLRQQCGGHADAAGRHAGRTGAQPGVLVLGHGVRRTSLPIREDFPASATNPMRQEQARAVEQMLADVDAARPASGALRGCATSTRGRARERPDRRRPARCAQQPAALCGAGGGQAARAPERVRQRLPHRMARACATTSTCATWPTAMWRCAICSNAVLLTVNLGRPRVVLEMVRGSSRPAPPVLVADVAACWADQHWPKAPAGLEGAPWHRAHVPGCLALAGWCGAQSYHTVMLFY